MCSFLGKGTKELTAAERLEGRCIPKQCDFEDVQVLESMEGTVTPKDIPHSERYSTAERGPYLIKDIKAWNGPSNETVRLYRTTGGYKCYRSGSEHGGGCVG